MKTCVLFLLVFCATGALHAQNPDTKRNWHWYFGVNAGLDFSSGAPVADTNGAFRADRGGSTISDINGNLLFYTQGIAIWNAQHDTMANGSDLGVGLFGTPYDGTVIIPKPGSESIYYLFTVDGFGDGEENGLRYHIVDMSANGGIGEVVQKNIQLFSDAYEEIAATRHANGCDYWVVTHDRYSADFLAYRVTADGVDPQPVISAVGYDYGAAQLIDFTAGGYMLRFDPAGGKLVQAFDWLYPNTGIVPELLLYQFDRTSGAFGDWFSMPIDTSSGAIAWSPNGQILYIEEGYDFARLSQYDVSVFDQAQVLASKYLIRAALDNLNGQDDLKIGPDGKLYACSELAEIFFGKDSIGVIEHPDVWGTGCNYRQWAVGLNGKFPTQSLPNFVSDFAAPEAPEHCITGIDTPGQAVNASIRWQDGYLTITPSANLIGRVLNINVFDARGRLILAFGNRVAGAEERLPMLGTSAGMYVVSVDTGGRGVIHDKVLVH